ncbi:HlyD family efflux transporter periplasmic adaptor subunit [Nonomuraea phyllanthi]|uniref:HlyD family efflux transporter periplasmic adaptor subunit n=1 Tax=Nonomuraea phyllanthi TaxID=2219224 RepID=A0A5C4VTB2_9ACTN|nr:HlyD family efflux transporter periplasmic adaptor subunit [Nonomuraea phyllanthi]KAB8190090.1 HlyD family efflux transporter periplasmic adaptor subunit [Nonomuraea phyllanthi]QFY08587.1 HlyD family efflux transporter periplasmic adaptor subunit [Nonomuraea phyllanthi]
MTNGALAVLLLGGAVLAYSQLGADEAAGETAVRTVTAARGSVTASVSASGAVTSSRSRALSFGTTGTVKKIYVKPGDKVSKGDILAELDDDAAQESLSAARATYDSALDDGTSTAQLYAAYIKARNAYREAQRTVAGTVLKAPFKGTITAVNGSVGGGSSGSGSGSGSSSGSGQGAGGTGSGGAQGSGGFIEMADTGRLQLVGTFTESDVGKLKQGQEAAVTFDALPGVTATGKVTQIEPVASTSNNVVQYPVTVTFTKVPGEVRLGQTATVEVVVGRADDVVTVPSTAISTSGGQTTVTVLRNGRQARTPVEVGVRGTTLTEITSGVSEGDQIVPPATTTGSTGGNLRLGGGGGFPGGGSGRVPGGGR